jgi:hypothetical protein
VERSWGGVSLTYEHNPVHRKRPFQSNIRQEASGSSTMAHNPIPFRPGSSAKEP